LLAGMFDAGQETFQVLRPFAPNPFQDGFARGLMFAKRKIDSVPHALRVERRKQWQR
jgi:hypothetical protein